MSPAPLRVLVTGAGGQLGRELVATARPAPPLALVSADRARLDITDRAAVRALVAEVQPDVIVNAAAWTGVDAAESAPEAARAVNVHGAAHLAEAALACGARLVHLSTDFVFAGTRGVPWRPDDPAEPCSVYGITKRDGERVVLDLLGDRALVLRTAWLYAAHGRNFVGTMLRLLRERGTVSVVADQVGTPTWARSLAIAVWDAVRRWPAHGIHHWTDAGVASWYDFAVAIAEEATARGLLAREATVRPIATADYPTPARRPAFSVLDCTATVEAFGVPRAHWRTGLRGCLDEWPGG